MLGKTLEKLEFYEIKEVPPVPAVPALSLRPPGEWRPLLHGLLGLPPRQCQGFRGGHHRQRN